MYRSKLLHGFSLFKAFENKALRYYKEIKNLEHKLLLLVKQVHQDLLTRLETIPGIGRKTAIMLVVLTGIMLGSLNKVWPWKQTISTYVNSHGVSKPLLEQSISPYSFNGDAQLTMAIVAAVIGFAIILVMEKLAKKAIDNALSQ